MNKSIENQLQFVIRALSKGIGLSPVFASMALDSVDIIQPSEEAINAVVNGFHQGDHETSIRIQQLSSDGTVVDEYLLPEQEIDDENSCQDPTIYDQLQDLARQEILLKSIGDHNYRKTYMKAVQLLAHNHVGYTFDDECVGLKGPLAWYVSNERQEELWERFLEDRGLSPDLD